MDYRAYHAINTFVLHHSWLGRGLSFLETWAVPVVAVATFALWLLARPGGSRKWAKFFLPCPTVVHQRRLEAAFVVEKWLCSMGCGASRGDRQRWIVGAPERK